MFRGQRCALTVACFFAVVSVSAQQIQSPPDPASTGQLANGPIRGRHNPPSGPKPSPTDGKVQSGPNLASAKLLPEVPNPLTLQLDSVNLDLLQRQRRAVDAEVRTQLKPIPRAAVPLAGNSQPMAAHSGGTSSSAVTTSRSPSLMSKAGGGTINPPIAGSSSAKVGALPSSATGNVALTCSTNPTMRILSVAGSAAPAVFTPITAYDLYTVSGCSFGNPGPDAKAYIYKGGTFREEFQIEEWHDNWLKLSLDCKISGVLDQDDVTLVIQRADGTQASKGGFKFHAVRSLTPLQVIPSRWAQLVSWSKDNKTFTPEYSSPAMINGKPAGPSAYVSRFVDNEKFDPNAQPPHQQYDIYDFSALAPGWTAKSAQLETFGTLCPMVVTYREDFGTWRYQWDGLRLRVYLGDETCTSVNPGIPLQHWDNRTGSYYRLTVFAYGPRCTDPITGKSEDECVRHVQQGAQ